jgi:hypothetical protein
MAALRACAAIMRATEQRIALERAFEPGRRSQLGNKIAVVLLHLHAHSVVDLFEFVFSFLDDFVHVAEFFGCNDRCFIEFVDADDQALSRRRRDQSTGLDTARRLRRVRFQTPLIHFVAAVR